MPIDINLSDLYTKSKIEITILTIVHVVLAVFLIVVVLFQSGKSAGLSGSIAGGAETFFGKKF